MSQVQTIAVIGAGIMGRGIAHAAALGGYRTILEDLLPGALRKAETEIRANLDKGSDSSLRTTPQTGPEGSAPLATFKRSSLNLWPATRLRPHGDPAG